MLLSGSMTFGSMNDIPASASSSPTVRPATSNAAPRLNTNAAAFVPGRPSKIVIKNIDGTEVDINALKEQILAKRSGAGNGKPVVRLESEDMKRKRVVEEAQIRIKEDEDAEQDKKVFEPEEKTKAWGKVAGKEKAKATAHSETTSSTAVNQSTRRPDSADTSPTSKHSTITGSSSFATIKPIEDLNQVPYPEGINSPKVEVNIYNKDGRFM